MKVRITFEVGDHEREGIAHYYGDSGKASYEQVRSFIERNATADIEEVAFQLQNDRGEFD